MRSLRRLFVLVLFCLSLSAQAQLITNTSVPIPQLVQNTLSGTGITVSNVTYTGFGSAIGYFDGSSTTLGLDSGIILTTGTAKDSLVFGQRIGPHGPNNQGAAGFDNGAPGDSDLEMLDSTNNNTFNAAILEFDFIASGDSIRINYVFGSEEYPEFAPPNGNVNDVFGILLSGPGIMGLQNIALVPDTTLPVSIGNINPSTNTHLYIDNNMGGVPPQNGDSSLIQYDGFTVVLTAIAAVVPGTTYHLKIGIADVGDGILDSGVFLEAGSFSGVGSVPYTDIDITTNRQNLREDCAPATVTFDRNSDLNVADTVILSYAGSADMGLDYNILPDTLLFPLGTDSLSVSITPFLDAVTEGNESIEVTAVILQQFVNDTVILPFQISDAFPLVLTVSPDVVLTCSDSTSLTATAFGGCGEFIYQWDNGITGSDTTELISPSNTTTYTVTVTDAISGQTVSDSVVVSVPFPIPLSLDIVPGDTTVTCGLTQVDLLADVTGGTPPFNYFWTSADTDSLTTIALESTDSVTLFLSDFCGVSTSETAVITVTNPVIETNFAVSPAVLEVDSVVSFSDLSTGAPTQWIWDFGDGNSSMLQNPTHIYNSIDTFEVCLIASNACFSDTFCQSVITNAANPLVAQFSAVANDLSATFTDESTPAASITTWSWDFGDGATSNVQHPSHTYSAEGMFTVCLEVSDGTFTDSTCTTINVIIDGIEEAGWLNDVTLYPNPTSGRLTLAIASPTQESMHLALYDLSGKQILVQDYGTSTNQIKLDLTTVENGLYHLVLSTPKGLSKRFPVAVMH